MRARATPARRRASAGYTLMELMLALFVFSLLGTMVVFFMSRGMDIFSTGTLDSGVQDRLEAVLPQMRQDLELLTIPSSFDPPPPPPTEEEQLAGREYVPPPPVAVRVRSGFIKMGDETDPLLKDFPCPYFAFVVSRWEDPVLLQLREGAGPEARDYVPEEVEADARGKVFRPTGGLVEVCYVAIPGYGEGADKASRSHLTLFRGYRSPIGGPGTLLDPGNLDQIEKVEKACRVVARDLLHFGVMWERVFVGDGLPTTGQVSETGPYLGPLWDSTRALDRAFPLFVDPKSLGDPSDDVFPAWVHLHVTLAGREGGVTYLLEGVTDQDSSLRVEDPKVLLGPGPEERWLKVDTEWMLYLPRRVSRISGKVPVERGGRGTVATAHDPGAPGGARVHVGLDVSLDLRLPVFRDRYAAERRGR